MLGRKRRREALFEQHPYCYWCEEKVVPFEWTKGKKTPPNSATIDHLYAKNDKRREKDNASIVLSCHRCNGARGDMGPERWEKSRDGSEPVLPPFKKGI